MFIWLAESMDFSKLGSSTREFCNACEDDRVLELRDLLNHIQGNDLGAGWIDNHRAFPPAIYACSDSYYSSLSYGWQQLPCRREKIAIPF